MRLTGGGEKRVTEHVESGVDGGIAPDIGRAVHTAVGHDAGAERREPVARGCFGVDERDPALDGVDDGAAVRGPGGGVRQVGCHTPQTRRTPECHTTSPNTGRSTRQHRPELPEQDRCQSLTTMRR